MRIQAELGCRAESFDRSSRFASEPTRYHAFQLAGRYGGPLCWQRPPVLMKGEAIRMPRGKKAKQRTPDSTGTSPTKGADCIRYLPRWSWAIAVFLLAFAYRGAYLYEATHHGGFDKVYMDEEYHLDWAESLVSGNWEPPYDQLHNAPFFRAPLYPYFLAGLVRVFGPNLTALRVVQAIVGALSCVLVYVLGTRWRGHGVGVAAGIGASLYWVLAYFDGELLLPVLLVFLGLCAFTLTYEAVARRNALLSALAGLAFGLFATTRPNMLAFYPFVVYWLVRSARRNAMPNRRAFVALFVLGCVVPPATVTVRNRVVGGDWVLVASQGGVNFYIGNNPESNGMEAVVPGTRHTWWGGFEDTKRIAEEAAGHPLKPSEVSRYWFGRAFSYIRDNPGHWVKLTARKTLALLGDVELPNNEPYEANRSRYLALRAIPLGFAVLCGLFAVALPGLIRPLLARKVEGEQTSLNDSFTSLVLQFIVVYSATIVAFFVTGRYRIPLVSFLLIGAAQGLAVIVDSARSRRWGALAWSVCLGVAVTGMLKIDHFKVRSATRGFAEYSRYLDCRDAGDLDGAIKGLQSLCDRDEMHVPDLYNVLVDAYMKRNADGDRVRAEIVAETGLRHNPADPQLLWYRSFCLHEEGQWDELLQTARRYIEVRPDDVRGYYLAVQAAIRTGQIDVARELVSKADGVHPGDPMVAKLKKQLNRL